MSTERDITAAIIRGFAKGNEALARAGAALPVPMLGDAAAVIAQALELAAELAESTDDAAAELMEIRRSYERLAEVRARWDKAPGGGAPVPAKSEPWTPDEP